MNRVVDFLRTYLLLVLLIIAIKLPYNYWALWSKVARMEELSFPEKHIVLFLNAIMFALVFGVIAFVLLILHASLSAYKVRGENKKIIKNDR